MNDTRTIVTRDIRRKNFNEIIFGNLDVVYNESYVWEKKRDNKSVDLSFLLITFVFNRVM